MSFTIHQSGIDAAKNAQANGFSGETLTHVKLYNASTLIKELPTVGVDVIEPARIYVVATDSTTDAYDVTRIEFYTSSGELFATAQHDDHSIIQSKGSAAVLSLAEQLNLSAAPGTIVPSGNFTLFAPPATEERLGSGQIATVDEVVDGKNDFSWLTSFKLSKWWELFVPQFAKRWPTFAEVTEKPQTYPPSEHDHRIIGNELYFLGKLDPRFFALDGSRIVNGVRDFPKLASSGSPFIRIENNDIVLMNMPDFVRGKGNSARAVGAFEGDAMRNLAGNVDFGDDDGTGMTSVHNVSGIFKRRHLNSKSVNLGWGAYTTFGLQIDLNGVVPIAHEFRSRSNTAIIAIYHGEL